MSHGSLVWANLCRRPLQSLLVLSCSVVAFAIYGVMFGTLESFRNAGIENALFEQQLLTGAISLSGVGMTLILGLTAASMAHTVRLRQYECGVLKALGFSHLRIIGLLMAEAAVPCVGGAALGLLLVPALFAAMAAGVPQLSQLPAPAYSLETLGGALGLALLLPAAASVLPALRIARLNAAAVLTGSAELAAPALSPATAPKGSPVTAPARVTEANVNLAARIAVRASPAGGRFLGHTQDVAGLMRQTLTVTRIGLSTLRPRLRSAMLVLCGVFCTTFVLLWFFSMAEGIRSALLSSGDPAVVVLKSDFTAWSLNYSGVPESLVTLASRMPGVARAQDGSPMVEAVTYATVGPLVRRSNGRPTGIDLIGVGPHWREMTPSFRLLSGRLPTPGTNEVIVGHLAPRALLDLDGGLLKKTLGIRQTRYPDVEWQVVGTFSTGDWHDGHLIADIDALRPFATDRNVTAVLVRLDSPHDFAAFRNAAVAELPPSVRVEREADTYRGLWQAVPKTLIYVASILASLLAAGAVLATMQVAHSALEARRLEIATLRVLGFDGRAAAISVLLEALPFAALGAWLAAGLVWWWRDGDLWAGAGSVFENRVDLSLMFVATGCAVAIAMIGTLPLAIRALRRGGLKGLRNLREVDQAASMGMVPERYQWERSSVHQDSDSTHFAKASLSGAVTLAGNA